jgi:TolB-like protein/Tfp pilus assembly protein PilF
MGVDRPQAPREPPGERLDSWKAIAAYLNRDESTVRRWEKEGLPVHRHRHKQRATVYAYTGELDTWWSEGGARLDAQAAAAGRPRRRRAWALAAGGLLLAAGLGWGAGGLHDRWIGRPGPGELRSVAVLPLANLSGDPQQEYFSDGMTDALITELGKVSALRVVSRTSVMPYKATKKPLAQVARELGADALVEGAVVREGDRVRVTARLTRTRPERQLWSEHYERELASILGLQGELARAIAAEIRATLTPQEEALFAKARPVSPAAYEAYLKGRYHWNKGSATGLLQTRAYFEEAIGKDPGFAPAYAGLADTYAWAYRWDAPSLRPPRETFARAKAAVLRALDLDDTLADAHASLAYIKEAYDWDWEGAEREYRRAIELNPSHPRAHHWYALYLTIPRRFDEAFAQMRRAEELDPLSRAIRRAKGWLYLWSGQVDRAIEQWRMTLELEGDFPQAHYALALAYTHKGLYQEAIGSHLKEIALWGQTPRSLALLAHAYGRAGQRNEALHLLADLAERAKREYVSGYLMAIAYVGLGNEAEALRWLERAFQERDPWLGELNAARFWFEPLRPEPHFRELVRRMRFPPTASH